MKNISYEIASCFGKLGIIKEDDIDICRYGLEIFLSSALEVLSIIIMSAFVKDFFETCIFFATFIPLRMYAGGYHANTKIRCYFISIFVYIIFTVLIAVIPQEAYILIIALDIIYSPIIVYIFAPVAHNNKHMSEIEKCNYKKIAFLICIVESLCCVILHLILKNKIYVVSIALGQLAATFAMGIAIIKSNFKLKNI